MKGTSHERDLNSLLKAEWLDEQAAQLPEQENAEAEQGIAAYKSASKEGDAELLDLAASTKLSASDIERENQKQNDFADTLDAMDQREVAELVDEDDAEAIIQATIEYNLIAQTVTGGGPGYYYDFNPYHSWGAVYRHNEGGLTVGSAGVNKSARKMYPFAHARGDGAGISDDNDVTTWTKLFFAFWPTRIGHVRALVPYTTRGHYRIYSNDKWYNSKEAKVDLDVQVRLYQNYWTGIYKDDVFRRSDDNINQTGRIDLSRSIYSGTMPVGAGR